MLMMINQFIADQIKQIKEELSLLKKVKLEDLIIRILQFFFENWKKAENNNTNF
jgi:hypothetical protein